MHKESDEGARAMALDADGADTIGAGTETASSGYQLRVLAGRHSGAVMPLPPGRYSLGQDETSDFIFLDDAFLGGQVVIDVSGVIPKLEVTGVVKALVEGLSPAPGQHIPLDSYQPVEVGATRFAIGPYHLPWPEPALPRNEAAPEATAATDASPGEANWPPPTEEEIAAADAKSAKAAKAAARRRRMPFVIGGSLLASGAIALGAWFILHTPVDPAVVLRGILNELKLPEVHVESLPGHYLLKGFLQTEAERETLVRRVKDFSPPVKTRLVSAEETRTSIQGVLDLYALECPITIGRMGKVTITCVSDNPRMAKEITESVRQGVQAETEVEQKFYPTGVAYPYINRMLAAKVLDHKVRLETQKGKVYGILVRNQMDSVEISDWNTIRASFKGQFGMDLEERWTDRLSPALLRFSAATRELDTQLVGVTVGELSYITLRNRRKFFEGARLASGLTVKSILRDRIVLSLDNVEQNYFLKKGRK